MARDDKKTSPAPKSGAAEKKEVAAKKDEGQPKDTLIGPITEGRVLINALRPPSATWC